MSAFECAAHKLLASEVALCEPADSDDLAWRLGGLSVRVVWLQGRLADVSADLDTAELEDGSGAVRLVGCSAVPGGTEWIQNGAYCMAVGELLSASPPEVQVIKLTPLPDVHRQMWRLEVEHARRHRQAAPSEDGRPLAA